MTVEIPLTRGYVALVDDDDAPAVLAAGKWYAKTDRRSTYARRTTRREDGTRTVLSLHTFLTGWSYVDHRNGDGLDNRRQNLRPATNEENGRNRRLHRNNRSGFRGVAWVRGRWQARISHEGRMRYLGRYPDPVSAARAYDEAARELRGEFARLNFPQEPSA
jgi:HNH endonuclease/AP2 domain